MFVTCAPKMQNIYNFEGETVDDDIPSFAFINDFEMARNEGHVARIRTINDTQKTSEIQETNPDFPVVDISLGDEENALNTEAALLDLVQLEERHSEAERMKAVGNKHMAGQNYMEAYEAYTAALQLSPVGPSSHVFLSNRAAALLSLKKYVSAASDARRAIALAPTFGKAHARLGQALYFLKDYAAAIEAYEDAIHFEPDNDVTLTYLEKAKLKFAKQQQKKLRSKSDNNSIQNDLASSSSLAESTQFSVQNSIATDPYTHHGVIQKNQYLGAANTSPIVKAAALHSLTKSKDVAQLGETRLAIGCSTVSVAASAMTADSEEIQRLNNIGNIGNISQYEQNSVVEEDHEFEEALRLQAKANKFLVQKQYRAAIEEYTAALFLVPDDQNLSPDLHLGRAHALNGSRRHESARNDALLAIKLNPTPAAFSTLAKSLFYMKEFAASIEAFETCRQLLPFGETLGLFDQAYLEKARNALNDDVSQAGKGQRHPAQNSPVPKLPPPRFVPRDEALHSQPPALRPMPKQWPQQTATSSAPLTCGHERKVVFLSEALGVKLNRGCDGIVRVLSVTQSAPGSAVARQGLIEKGDIVREAAGVDIRRPITNIMWGDTVALIKMAPRPISFLVSKELSPVPPAVLDEQNKKETEEPIHTFVRPSSASGEEPLKNHLNETSSIEFIASNDVYAYSTQTSSAHEECETFEDGDIMEIKEIVTHDIVEVDARDAIGSHPCSKFVLTLNDRKGDGFEYATSDKVHEPVSVSESGIFATDVNLELSDETDLQSKDLSEAISDVGRLSDISGSDPATQCIMDIILEHNDSEDEDIVEVETSLLSNKPPQTDIAQQDVIEICQPIRTTLWEDELKMVGGSILFNSDKDATMHFGEWDTLRWLACSGQRKVSFCQKVYRQFDYEKKRSLVPSFWKSDRKRFENRALAIYQFPNLILILRRPVCMEEVRDLLGQDALDPFDHNCDKYWIVESTIDPSHAKLRLSPLTTLTSLAYDDRDRSCFQIISPLESVILSAVHAADVLERKQGVSFKDSGAYLETLALETAIATTICAAQSVSKGNESELKHQIVIGTLHSLVISGNIKMLSEALNFARSQCNLEMNTSRLPAHIVDAVDDFGFPALYYACKHGMHRAIDELVAAGANKAFRIPPNNETLLQLVARNLDEESLLIHLSGNSTSQPDPNAVDSEIQTPMYVAATSISPSKTSANRTHEDVNQSSRGSLFSGLFENASAFFLEGNATTSTVAGNNLVSSVSGNRDALNQRGVKLGALNDKSAQLVEASADFAQLARELRKQSEKGLFW